MRVLGLDHGTRRIGVAVGDTETGLAFSRAAIRTRRADAAVAAVLELAVDEAISQVIVGLPRNMDGSEGPQAARARGFGARLASAGLRVEFADERLSSWQAGQDLQRAGRRPPRRSGELDSAAAQLVLQQYLDAMHSPS